MGKLFEDIVIDEEVVKTCVLEHWGLTLDKNLNKSQNHTFLALDSSNGTKRIVRVTPDPHNNRRQGIEAEVVLLKYLKDSGLPVCASLPSNNGSPFIVQGELVITAFEYATGIPVVFHEMTWINDSKYIEGLGRWFAQLHKLTRQFASEHPQLVEKFRLWSDVHDHILVEAPIDPRDANNVSSPNHFGIIHGDINTSNLYWNPDILLPSVYDWDQTQRGWLLYDVAQPIWGVLVALQSKLVPKPENLTITNSIEDFVSILVKSYETEADTKIDIGELERMVALRRELYHRFCTRAITELTPESKMYGFCKFMADWLADNTQGRYSSPHSGH